MRGRRPFGRGRWAGIAAVLALGILLTARPASLAHADPTAEAEREAVLRAVALTADGAWAELQAALEAARAPARRGAALVVEGNQPPDPALRAAAALLDAASGAADAAGIAERRLLGTLQSVRPDLVGLLRRSSPIASEVTGIATQLRSAAEASAEFVALRHAAEETLLQMQAALAALARDDIDTALGALDDAARARRLLQDWDPPPPTLSLWLSTTRELINAARAIGDAVIAGDPEAARAASDAYAAAADEARRADVSLALSLSETGAGLTATPLRRLADALAATADARSAVASLLQGDV